MDPVKLRAEIDDAVREFAQQIAERDSETTGIPRPARIDVSESSIENQPFDLDLDREPDVTAATSSGPGGGGPPPPDCPAISVVCDSISASKSKCGFGEFGTPSSPPKYYLTQTETGTGEYHRTCGDTRDQSQSFSGNCVTTYDPSTCESSVTTDTGTSAREQGMDTCSMAISICSQTGNCETLGCWVGLPTWCANCAGGSGSECNCTADSNTSYTCVSNCDHGPPEGCTECSGTDTRNATLSDEYTTSTLIDNTVSALPDYDDDFDDACGASRDLSDDETSYTIQRFKPKFTIATALDHDLVICYNEHFVPDVGDPVDTSNTATIPAGETEIISDEVLEPDEDGEITITNVTCCP